MAKSNSADNPKENSGTDAAEETPVNENAALNGP